MNLLKELIFLILCCSISGRHIGAVQFEMNTKKAHDNKAEPFIPTSEWQIVKDGQQIPPGLHIRSNLQTGITEAKLMEGKEKSGKIALPAIVVKEGGKATHRLKKPDPAPKKPSHSPPNSKTSLSREEILAALKDVGKSDDVKDKKIAEEAKKKKFRSYEELKKDFEKINVKIRTDMEIIKQYVAKLKNTSTTTQEKIATLTDLEYYLHQIDNARDFADINGLDLLIKEMVHPEWRVRSEANFAMGSALQSNVKVQIRAFELGLLPNLLHQLASERESACLNRVLYALSALLRNFPFAQLQFVQQGGLKRLGQLFRDAARSQLRHHVRMITMFTDLLGEKTSHEASMNRTDPMDLEKARQYQRVNFAQHLLDEKWCSMSVPLLFRCETHDCREKVLKFLLASASICPPRGSGQNPPVKLQGLLMELNAEYVKLAAEERAEGDTGGYFSGLQRLVRNLLESTTPSVNNDEL